MLEFKNYGVQELNEKELYETEGGLLIELLAGIFFGFMITRYIQNHTK